MNKNDFSFIGVLTILIFVVFISGCTTTTNPEDDLYLSSEIHPSPNGPANEWGFNGMFDSRSNANYKEVTIEFIGYDAQNNTVGTKTLTIPYNQAHHFYFQVVMTANGTVDHVGYKILNVTKA